MTFSDIFNKTFLDGFTSVDINIYTASAAILITGVIAIYIFFVYRVMTRKTFYNNNFNVAVACVAVITAAIILTIQSSIVVSLGMVGALSIVRFRTAIKDPIDLMFMFWAIAVGIICGVGMAEIAIILSLVLTVGILILNKMPLVKEPMLLVINATDLDAEEKILFVVKQYAKSTCVKSRNITKNTLDMIIEVRTSEGAAMVRKLMGLESVVSASLLEHDGEVTF